MQVFDIIVRTVDDTEIGSSRYTCRVVRTAPMDLNRIYDKHVDSGLCSRTYPGQELFTGRLWFPVNESNLYGDYLICCTFQTTYYLGDAKLNFSELKRMSSEM